MYDSDLELVFEMSVCDDGLLEGVSVALHRFADAIVQLLPRFLQCFQQRFHLTIKLL